MGEPDVGLAPILRPAVVALRVQTGPPPLAGRDRQLPEHDPVAPLRRRHPRVRVRVTHVRVLWNQAGQSPSDLSGRTAGKPPQGGSRQPPRQQRERGRGSPQMQPSGVTIQKIAPSSTFSQVSAGSDAPSPVLLKSMPIALSSPLLPSVGPMVSHESHSGNLLALRTNGHLSGTGRGGRACPRKAVEGGLWRTHHQFCVLQCPTQVDGRDASGRGRGAGQRQRAGQTVGQRVGHKGSGDRGQRQGGMIRTAVSPHVRL